MGFLKLLGGLLAVVVLAVAALFIGARFADGPLELIAGGPFTSGTVYSGAEPDWSSIADRPTVEFQLLDPARSRTAWIVEHDGRIYIPCGYMDTAWGRLWKHWPIEAEKDGRALLRVDDTIYPRQLKRIKDGPAVGPVVTKLMAKYGGNADFAAGDGIQQVASDSLWLFEMAPPAG